MKRKKALQFYNELAGKSDKEDFVAEQGD
jgi:hypothetical protein